MEESNQLTMWALCWYAEVLLSLASVLCFCIPICYSENVRGGVLEVSEQSSCGIVWQQNTEKEQAMSFVSPERRIC